MNIPYLDSHFHITEMRKKGVNTEELLTKIFSGIIRLGLDIGIGTEHFPERLTLAEKHPRLFMACGLYPGTADKKDWNEDLDILESQLQNPKVIALGEIGLDWHWNYGTREKQIELFETQLELAGRLNLPVLIHNRLADKEVIACLKRIKPPRGGILHCFSSGKDTAFSCVELGFLISFAGNCTYPGAKEIREAAKALPAEHIILETDAPYLSPLPERGKINTPDKIIHTYNFIAELRQTQVEALAEQVVENFSLLFPETKALD